ncbi:MAG: OmpA family protein [Bacteroidota bacterium]
MKRLNILLVLACLLLSVSAFGQSKRVKKANEFYKLNKYSEAIPLYEKELSKKHNLGIKTRLANCYRLTNQMDKAESLYAEIVQDEKAKDIAFYYYGETLMSNEKYDQARDWFLEYSKRRPDDENGPFMVQSCEQVRFIQPMFQGIRVKNFTQNTDFDDTAPVFYRDAIIFSSDRNQGTKLLKQKSGWTGRDFVKLYQSTQNADGTFEPAKSFSNRINELNKNTGPITFNQKGDLAVFTRNSKNANQRDIYPMQLFSAETNDGKKWRNIEPLPFCRLSANFMHPALSPDGNTLYFVSDKGRGEGGTDIYVSTRTQKGWSKAQNLGPIINTRANEGFPFVSPDGKLFFCSKGHIGFGGFDIFYTEKDEAGNWIQPVNAGKPINSSYDDISIFIYPDGTKGMFTSAREGGDDDIYFFQPKEQEEETEMAFLVMSENNQPIKIEEMPTNEVNEIEENSNEPDSIEETMDQSPPKEIGVGNIADNENKGDEVKVKGTSTLADATENKPKPTETLPEEDLNTDLAIAENEEEFIAENEENSLGDLTPTAYTDPPANNTSPSTSISPMEPEVSEERLVDQEVYNTNTIIDEPEMETVTSNDVNTDLNDVPIVEETLVPSTSEETPSPMPALEEDIANTTFPDEEVLEESTSPPNIEEEVLEEMSPSNTETETVYSESFEEETTPSLQEATVPVEYAPVIESRDVSPSQIDQNGEIITSKENKTLENGWNQSPEAQPTFVEEVLPMEADKRAPIPSEAPLTINTYQDLEYAMSQNRLSLGQSFKLPNIQFPFNQFDYQINSNIQDALSSLIGILKTYPDLRIEVGAYTESYGEDKVNMALSRYRAEAIVSYITAQGVDQGRLSSRGYGESKPLNHCQNGVLCTRAQHLENQRVEIKVLGL